MPPRPSTFTDTEKRMATLQNPEPESDRSAPWGVGNIERQTNQEGGFVNTTFDV
jgi:hypothetical protein